MAGKKGFALRIDPAMLEALEKWASDEFRSVNGQIEWILASALKERGRYPARGKSSGQDHAKSSDE